MSTMVFELSLSELKVVVAIVYVGEARSLAMAGAAGVKGGNS